MRSLFVKLATAISPLGIGALHSGAGMLGEAKLAGVFFGGRESAKQAEAEAKA